MLILRRSATDPFLPGIEELPSGGVEYGEDLLTALPREGGEEIDWAGPLTPDPGFVSSFDYTSGSGRQMRQYTLAVAYTGHEIQLSDEHTAYRWIDPADLGASDLTPETARTIREWARGTN